MPSVVWINLSAQSKLGLSLFKEMTSVQENFPYFNISKSNRIENFILWGLSTESSVMIVPNFVPDSVLRV